MEMNTEGTDPRNTCREKMLEIALKTLLSDPSIVAIADEHVPDFAKYVQMLVDDRKLMHHSNYKPLTIDTMLNWSTVHGGEIFAKSFETMPGVVKAAMSSGALLMATHLASQFGGVPDILTNPADDNDYEVPSWLGKQMDALTDI